jgi:hypothetical protein
LMEFAAFTDKRAVAAWILISERIGQARGE